MTIKHSRRWFLGSIAITVPVAFYGCGTFLHPERMGQTRGPIDWRIAALDGAGLLLFFVPGVIAFAVDFYNGTIFLPPEGYEIPPEDYEISENENPELESVQVPKGSLDSRKIETVVANHTGKHVNLAATSTYTETMTNIKQFWSKLGQLQAGKHRSI